MPPELVGRWNSVEVKSEDEGAWTLELRTDGTFSGEQDAGFGIVEPFTGLFVATDSELSLTSDPSRRPSVFRFRIADSELHLTRKNYQARFRQSADPHPVLAALPRPPQTKSEAVAILLAKLPEEARREIALTRRDSLVKFHMGLGMYIRNGFGLWRGNRALIEDLGGGVDSHPDNLSGIIIEALWDELHKGEVVPVFDETKPAAYFVAINAWLQDAKARNDTQGLIHLPMWVLKDRPPHLAGYDAAIDPALAAESYQLIEADRPLMYLGLLYLAEFTRTGEMIELLEASLDREESVPIPLRKIATDQGFDAAVEFAWEPISLGGVALFMLAEFRGKEFPTVAAYREWKKTISADALLSWKYRAVISDADLATLRADPINFTRILCRTRRWLVFSVGEATPQITEEGLALLHRLDETSPEATENSDRPERETRAMRLLQLALSDVPEAEILRVLRDEEIDRPGNWRNDRELEDPVYFPTSVLLARESSLDANRVEAWDVLRRYAVDAPLDWRFRLYLWRWMFRADFTRTDELARSLLDFATLPTDGRALSVRVSLIEVMIDDYFGSYRDLIKELYFATQDFEGQGREYRWKLNNRLLSGPPTTKNFYWEIERDPRFHPAD